MSQPLLNHDRITADDGVPERWMLVLHGIYGAGRNWNSVVRSWVRERPEWGAVPTDLRQHGGSTGFAPPHTLDAAAEDLRALVREERLEARAVLGHSFGGKVALVYAREPEVPLERIWIVDSTPDAREPSGSAWEMLEVLRGTPGPFASRDAAVGALQEMGVAPAVARWMATNLESPDETGGTYRWRIDPGDMEALLLDFFRTDAWDVVESPPDGARIHFVKADASSVLDEEACARIEAAGRRTGRVRLHRLEGGHWLNADNPEGLVRLLLEYGGEAEG